MGHGEIGPMVSGKGGKVTKSGGKFLHRAYRVV